MGSMGSSNRNDCRRTSIRVDVALLASVQKPQAKTVWSAQLYLMLYVPNAAVKPAPVFLGLNYWGNASVENDTEIPLSDRWMRPSPQIGIVNNRATAGTRGVHASRWPLALALKRGYAVATFFYGDIEEDHSEGWKNGLRGYSPSQTAWFSP
jgi:hypothetical protein